MAIARAHTGAQRELADWESRVGSQFRALRETAGLDQAQLAESAGVSLGAVKNLEQGKGSTLKTIVGVSRALGREDWLDTIAPSVRISPIDLLRTGRPTRNRVYRPRREVG